CWPVLRPQGPLRGLRARQWTARRALQHGGLPRGDALPPEKPLAGSYPDPARRMTLQGQLEAGALLPVAEGVPPEQAVRAARRGVPSWSSVWRALCVRPGRAALTTHLAAWTVKQSVCSELSRRQSQGH